MSAPQFLHLKVNVTTIATVNVKENLSLLWFSSYEFSALS